MKKIIAVFSVFVLIHAVLLSSCSKKRSDDGNTNSNGYIGEKVPSDLKAVGDIIFNDGSATSYASIKGRLSNDNETGTKITKAEQDAAIAVVFFIGNGLNNDNSKTDRVLGVGLKHNRNGLKWCKYNSEKDKANAYSENITLIQCSTDGNAGKLVFKGTKDGSKNLEQIGQYMIAKNMNDDTSDYDNYPAFAYAKNYSSYASNLEAFTSDWYLPSAAELFELWSRKETVDAAIEMCGGDKLGTSYYWTSSQYPSIDNNAYYMDFYYGDSVIGYKDDDSYYVCAIREF